jgi:hypothetical protein
MLSASAATGGADEPKEKGIQCDTKHLDKKWNLKCKSVISNLRVGMDFGEVRIVFEFTKDVEADTVKTIQKAFEGGGSPHVNFCFFDKDDVLISKRRFASIKGEVTGKPGEAFRVVIGKCRAKVLGNTRKIGLRLAKDEK